MRIRASTGLPRRYRRLLHQRVLLFQFARDVAERGLAACGKSDAGRSPSRRYSWSPDKYSSAAMGANARMGRMFGCVINLRLALMYPPPTYWANAAVVINRLRTNKVFFMAISPIWRREAIGGRAADVNSSTGNKCNPCTKPYRAEMAGLAWVTLWLLGNTLHNCDGCGRDDPCVCYEGCGEAV